MRYNLNYVQRHKKNKIKPAFAAILHVAATTQRQLQLQRLSYLPAHCELLVCRRKNFHGAYLNYIYFGWTHKAADVGVKRRRHFLSFFFFNPSFRSGSFLRNVRRGVKTPSPILSISDRLQTVGDVPACPARARQMAREAVAQEPEWHGQQPMASSDCGCQPIRGSDERRDPPPLPRPLLTVRWIKEASEISSLLLWNVGHWLEPVQSEFLF